MKIWIQQEIRNQGYRAKYVTSGIDRGSKSRLPQEHLEVKAYRRLSKARQMSLMESAMIFMIKTSVGKSYFFTQGPMACSLVDPGSGHPFSI